MQSKHTIHNGVTQEHMETPHCPRCKGFLVRTDYMDMLQGGYLWGRGQRCINCGHLMDPKILVNQLLHKVGRELGRDSESNNAPASSQLDKGEAPLLM